MTLITANAVSPPSQALFITVHATARPINAAEKQLLRCISLLRYDGAFLPITNKQALGKAKGKHVAARLQIYEQMTSIQEKHFQQAVAAQQRDYQTRLLATLQTQGEL